MSVSSILFLSLSILLMTIGAFALGIAFIAYKTNQEDPDNEEWD